MFAYHGHCVYFENNTLAIDVDRNIELFLTVSSISPTSKLSLATCV